jgi:hypothetical protein
MKRREFILLLGGVNWKKIRAALRAARRVGLAIKAAA